MILSHPSLEHTISIEDGSINVLVVENPEMLCKYIEELKSQSSGFGGRFNLYDGVKCIDFNNIVRVIMDPFSIDLNSKEILTPIYSKLSSISNNESHYADYMDLSSRIIEFISDLVSDLGISMECKDSTSSDLFKIASPKLLSMGDTLLERIVEYLDLSSEYSKIKLYVFINLNSYLSSSELFHLYQHISYHKTNVLFVESKHESIISNERLIIIDKDLCELSL